MEFCEVLKLLREDSGMTQDALGKEIGLKAYNIGDLERKRSTPAPEILIALANVFDCSVDYLLGRENDFGIIESNQPLKLSEEKSKLLSLYNSLTKAQQKLVIDYILYIKKNTP
ncbi:MAG: helix-turn-helix transcriptional regulator [Clostridia bacterium]